jgi:hypothetical protein
MNLVKNFQTDYFAIRWHLFARNAFENWKSTLWSELEKLMVFGCRNCAELQTMIVTVYLMSWRSPGTSNLQEAGCEFWSEIIKFVCIKIFPFLLFPGLSQYATEHHHISRPTIYATRTNARTHAHTHTHIYILIINSSSPLLHKTNWFLSSSSCRYHTI